MYMKIEFRQQTPFNNLRASSRNFLTPALLTIAQFALVTMGFIFIAYLLITSSTQETNAQASLAQKHKMDFTTKFTNKRRLIVALQSLRMHNVTRYQRKPNKSLEQSLLLSTKDEDISADLTRLSRVHLIRSENSNASSPYAASLKPVEHGW